MLLLCSFHWNPHSSNSRKIKLEASTSQISRMSCWTSPCLRGFRTFPNTWSVISSRSRHVPVQSKSKSRNVTKSVVFSFSKTEAKIGTKRDTSKHASIAKCPSLSSCSNQFENFILLKYLVTKLECCAISGISLIKLCYLWFHNCDQIWPKLSLSVGRNWCSGAEN